MVDISQLKIQAETMFATQLSLVDTPASGFQDWQQISQLVAALARRMNWKIIGVSGAQGTGKSSLSATLAQSLQHMMLAQSSGLSVRAASIDDFYLSRQRRTELAARVHPLLQTRGVPGTHDTKVLSEVLTGVSAGSARIGLPRFDKGLDDCVDSLPLESVDVLILEGWCMGVKAEPLEALAAPCNELERTEDAQGVWRNWVNERISQDYEPLWSQVDFWLHLRVPSFAQVMSWRSEQEQQIPADQRMTSVQIARFIKHYERLTRWMLESEVMAPGLSINLDASHRVAQCRFVLPSDRSA